VPDQATYIDKYAAGFERSLKRLGPAAAAQVAAELQSFMRAWRRGDSAMDLNRSWTFKPIQGEEAKRWKVMQIYILRDYRVLLVDVAESTPPCIWFLEVFRKTSKNAEYIKRAIERARSIREAQR
jgi:hypothetical protein